MTDKEKKEDKTSVAAHLANLDKALELARENDVHEILFVLNNMRPLVAAGVHPTAACQAIARIFYGEP